MALEVAELLAIVGFAESVRERAARRRPESLAFAPAREVSETDPSGGEERKARRVAMLAGLPAAWTGRAVRAWAAAAPSETRFRAGENVCHPSLGERVVVSSADDEEVTVAFPEKGVMKLVASLAKLARA